PGQRRAWHRPRRRRLHAERPARCRRRPERAAELPRPHAAAPDRGDLRRGHAGQHRRNGVHDRRVLERGLSGRQRAGRDVARLGPPALPRAPGASPPRWWAPPPPGRTLPAPATSHDGDTSEFSSCTAPVGATATTTTSTTTRPPRTTTTATVTTTTAAGQPTT